jgi:hypothetical protein
VRKRAFTLIGGLLLVTGLAVALITTHYESKVLGQTNLGVTVLAPNQGAQESEGHQRLRREFEALFWIGVALIGAGVALQTAGALIET